MRAGNRWKLWRERLSPALGSVVQIAPNAALCVNPQEKVLSSSTTVMRTRRTQQLVGRALKTCRQELHSGDQASLGFASFRRLFCLSTCLRRAWCWAAQVAGSKLGMQALRSYLAVLVRPRGGKSDSTRRQRSLISHVLLQAFHALASGADCSVTALAASSTRGTVFAACSGLPDILEIGLLDGVTRSSLASGKSCSQSIAADVHVDVMSPSLLICLFCNAFSRAVVKLLTVVPFGIKHQDLGCCVKQVVVPPYVVHGSTALVTTSATELRCESNDDNDGSGARCL